MAKQNLKRAGRAPRRSDRVHSKGRPIRKERHKSPAGYQKTERDYNNELRRLLGLKVKKS